MDDELYPNRSIKFWVCRTLGTLALLLIAPTSVAPQSQSPSPTPQEPTEVFEPIVSGVRANVIEGEVTHRGPEATFDLIQGLELQEGDVVSTSSTGRAELLLQPGNYLRLGANTQLHLIGKAYDRIRLQLDKGTLGFELVKDTEDRRGSFLGPFERGYELIRVITPDSEVLISEPGIFRIDVGADERTKLTVRDGESYVDGQRVKTKQVGTSAHGTVTISRFDPKSEDPFDSWCRERAGKLIQVNHSLKEEAPWASARKDGREPSVDLPGLESRAGNSYVVSARAGSISFTETGVEIGQSEKGWNELTLQTVPVAGDKLRTDAHSHAELILLPDLFLRLDGNSEILLEALSNDAITIRLLRGAIILDAAKFDEKILPPLRVAGPATSVVIAEEGNYRFEVRNGIEQVTVRKGKVIYSGHSVGSCRKILNGSETDCGKKTNDNFDFWSAHRGEGNLYNGNTMADNLARVRRQRFRSTGFWYRLSSVGYYTFVPFSLTTFDSPYGGNYSSVLSSSKAPFFRHGGLGEPVPFARPASGPP